MKNSLGLLIVSFACSAAMTFSTAYAASEIVVGRTLPLSGPLASYGVAKKEGADALIARINREGGVQGQKIRVVTLDDEYNPQKTVANLRKIAEVNQPTAFLGLFGVPTVAAALPVINELKIPAVGVTSGAAIVRATYSPYVFPVRASYAEEATLIVEHMKRSRLTRIAIVQQDVPFGQVTRDIFVNALAKSGVTIVSEHKVSASGDNANSVIANVAKSAPQAVFLAMLSGPAIPVMTELSEQLIGIPSYAFSPVDASVLIKQSKGAAVGLGVTQIVPIPTGTSMRVLDQYRRDLQTNKAGEPSFYSLEGYLEAAVMVEGFKRTRGAATIPGLIKALETMGPYNNQGFSVQYSPTSHDGSRFVDLTVVGRTGVMR